MRELILLRHAHADAPAIGEDDLQRALSATGLAEAQANACRIRERVYHPIPENQAVYTRLYRLYRALHDAFGTATWTGQLDHIMKELIDIRQEAREG